jgi:reactive intermediate/imine deaminase
MVYLTSIVTAFLVVTGVAIAKPTPKLAEQPVVTYLGTQGPILCTSVSVNPHERTLTIHSKRRVDVQRDSVHFRHGTLTQRIHCNRRHRSTNGTHPRSLSPCQLPTYSVQAQVIKNIAAVLEEAGTSWDYVMKTTVFLANMSDYAAMNEVYAAMLPTPKPARTAVEVGKLPGNFLIEVEAIAAIPDS